MYNIVHSTSIVYAIYGGVWWGMVQYCVEYNPMYRVVSRSIVCIIVYYTMTTGCEWCCDWLDGVHIVTEWDVYRSGFKAVSTQIRHRFDTVSTQIRRKLYSNYGFWPIQAHQHPNASKLCRNCVEFVSKMCRTQLIIVVYILYVSHASEPTIDITHHHPCPPAP